MKKYELTSEFVEQQGKKLFRIKALINFSNVAAGAKMYNLAANMVELQILGGR